MANRFARRIRDGDIASPEDLKSEFKTLAKSTHPDLAGSASAAEFARIREDYESALRDFERHRFGARPSGRRQAGSEAGGLPPDARLEAFAALAMLRKRGFPKVPRHEKEKLRYGYARRRCVGKLAALDQGLADGFPGFEDACLALGGGGRGILAAVLESLDGLIEYAALGLPDLRTALALGIGSLREDGRVPAAASGFVLDLGAALGVGLELPR